MAPARRPRAGGFSLIEIVVVLALTALLVTIALPALTSPVTQARRGDAVAALTRLQLAQEQFRAQHGLYAADLQALQGVRARSDAGHYELRLERTAPLVYVAEAVARRDGAQAHDEECARIAVRVSDGLPDPGPSPRCWNR